MLAQKSLQATHVRQRAAEPESLPSKHSTLLLLPSLLTTLGRRGVERFPGAAVAPAHFHVCRGLLNTTIERMQH
jgi:hypothetical protein